MNKSCDEENKDNNENNENNENKDTKEEDHFIEKNQNINELINENNNSNDINKSNNEEEKNKKISFENNVYQKNYIDKVEMLQFLIDMIKNHSYEKNKNEIVEKNKKKKELENNINILTSKLNNIKIQKKNFNILSKSIQNEKAYIDKHMKKNIKDLYCKDDLDKIKYEIYILLNKIKKEKEDLTNNNIFISETKREIHLIKDEIKKHNNAIRQLNTENDIYKNTLRLLDKHILLVKEKLDKQKNKSNNFFIALTNLALKSRKCDMERKYIESINKSNKRANSSQCNKRKKLIYNFNYL